jgi:hypothetical protein
MTAFLKVSERRVVIIDRKRIVEVRVGGPTSFVRECHAPHRKDFFNIAKTQSEAEIKPNEGTDDFSRKAMSTVGGFGGSF